MHLMHNGLTQKGWSHIAMSLAVNLSSTNWAQYGLTTLIETDQRLITKHSTSDVVPHVHRACRHWDHTLWDGDFQTPVHDNTICHIKWNQNTVNQLESSAIADNMHDAMTDICREHALCMQKRTRTICQTRVDRLKDKSLRTKSK